MRALDFVATFAQAACVGEIDLFTNTERMSPDDEAFATSFCSNCPVFDACDELRRSEKPVVGIWAGKRIRNIGGMPYTR